MQRKMPTLLRQSPAGLASPHPSLLPSRALLGFSLKPLGWTQKGTGRECSGHGIHGRPFPGELALPSNLPLLFILTKLQVRSWLQPKHPSKGLPARLSPRCGIRMGIQHFTLIWEVIISAFTRDDEPIIERNLIMRGEEKLMSCSEATSIPLWLFQTLWAHPGKGRSCSNISIKPWTMQLLSCSTARGQGAPA